MKTGPDHNEHIASMQQWEAFCSAIERSTRLFELASANEPFLNCVVLVPVPENTKAAN